MDQEVYYEDNVKKRREEREVWEAYWAVLRNNTIFLYTDESDVKNSSAECYEEIHINPGARCAVVKRRTYSFRFKVVTTENEYFFKCVSNLQRHRWMHNIELAARNRVFFPRDQHASGLLLQPVLTDTDLKRYLYGEDKEKDEINNNNKTGYKGKPVLSVARASSAILSARALKVKESRRVKSATHLPWNTRVCRVHANDTADLGRRLENLAFSDDRKDMNAISSKKPTIGSDTMR